MKPKENPPCTAVVFRHSSCILVFFFYSFSVITCESASNTHSTLPHASPCTAALPDIDERDKQERRKQNVLNLNVPAPPPPSPISVQRKERLSTVCNPPTHCCGGGGNTKAEVAIAGCLYKGTISRLKRAEAWL